jgi:preprotein translocase subunit SecE
MTDKLKLLLAGLLVVAGLAGFYLLGDQVAMVLRVLSVLAGVGLALAVVRMTGPGQQMFALGQESIVEARKVVWPTRRETLQMTGVVLLFAVVMAVFLWLVDSLLGWLIQNLMGRVS